MFGDMKPDFGKFQLNCFALQYSFEHSALFNNYFSNNINIAVMTPTSALINHECIPNTLRLFIGDLQIIIARKFISSGSEITTSYQFFSYESLLKSKLKMK